MATFVLFSMPVTCRSKYAWLVIEASDVLYVLVAPADVPVASSVATLPAVANSQTPIARPKVLLCVAVTVSLAAVVSPVSSSEYHMEQVTPSCIEPALYVYSPILV